MRYIKLKKLFLRLNMWIYITKSLFNYYNLKWIKKLLKILVHNIKFNLTFLKKKTTPKFPKNNTISELSYVNRQGSVKCIQEVFPQQTGNRKKRILFYFFRLIVKRSPRVPLKCTLCIPDLTQPHLFETFNMTLVLRAKETPY